MPRPALEAPPLSASMGKKDSKDAVDTPGHSKKSGRSAGLSWQTELYAC